MSPLRHLNSLLAASAAVLAMAALPAQQVEKRTEPWDPQALQAMKTLPLLDEGRIKPFDTYAQFLMLRLNEHRGKRLPDDVQKYGELAGTTIGPTDWAMDVLFYPEHAANYPVIVVTDKVALTHIGLGDISRKKRDRYSFNELLPGVGKLTELYREYTQLDEKDRERVQNQIVYLHRDLLEHSWLMSAADSARARFEIGDSQTLAEIFPGRESVRFSEALRQLDKVLARYRDMAGHSHQSTEGDSEDSARLSMFVHRLEDAANRGNALLWIPPSDLEVEEWYSITSLFQAIAEKGPKGFEREIALVQDFERVVDAAAQGPAAVTDPLQAWVNDVKGAAAARGEAEKIDLEVAYYDADLMFRSWLVFLLTSLLIAFGWLFARAKTLSRVLYVISWLGGIAATGLLTWGITMRCILRERPPVTTLYETILFVACCVALTGLAIEAINRRRIGLSMGVVLGLAGVTLAQAYEMHHAQDTMPQLQAVLDTNYYLLIHVTTVTLGYAAGLLAGGLAHIYLLGKLFGFKLDDRNFYRSLGRMVYGVLAFGVLLSTFGTIYGGVWANDSWGRFWGWDPKENGALMIVLWELMILHARLGGFIRDWGVCLLAVLGNIVVAFSWWHVNLLGVGLHSYGFEPGTKQAVFLFYGSQLLVLGLGLIAWWLRRDPPVGTAPSGGSAA